VNSFVVEIWDDEADRCTFYTVKGMDDELSETDKFFNKFDKDPQLTEATAELLTFVLKTIGDDHGAIEALFNRPENEVVGLPAKGKISFGEVLIHYPGFPLRLYALKIRENIVVLFNGGVKDGPTNQTSSLKLKWIEACQFAQRIDRAIADREIIIDETHRLLRNNDDTLEIIL